MSIIFALIFAIINVAVFIFMLFVCICICICIVLFQWWCPHSSVLYGLRKNVTGRETSLEEDIKQGFLSNPAPENLDYDEDLCFDSYN